MTYDKNRFINNVRFLAEKRNLKMKDLETAGGVAIGYFSRLKQGEKNVAPGAELLIAVAEKLSVTVDALLTYDFSQISETEAEVMQYLDKLITETKSRKLAWQEDPAGYLDTTLVNPDGTVPHPLFTNNPRTGAISYHSMFHADSETLGLAPRKTYGCIFPGERTLYLVRVGNEKWNELELVMTGKGIPDPIPLAHTNHEKDTKLDAPMSFLYRAVTEAAALPTLTPEAKDIIKDYLRSE